MDSDEKESFEADISEPAKSEVVSEVADRFLQEAMLQPSSNNCMEAPSLVAVMPVISLVLS